MNGGLIRSLIIGAALLAGSANNISAAEAPKEQQAIFDKLISAIMKDDYESFVADGDDSFKEKMTENQFAAAVGQLSTRLNAGYQATYLGAIKKSGGQVLLWQLTLKGVEDELLVTLSVKDGKVHAFMVR
jgi:hypothetical protein